MIDRLQAIVPFADLLGRPSTPHFWNINWVQVDQAGTTISGWCLPVNGELNNSALSINGKVYPLDHVQTGGEEYSRIYPWFPYAWYSGFVLHVPELHSGSMPTELVFECVARNGEALPNPYRLNLLTRDLSFEMPPPEMAARIGVEDLLQYVMYGRAIYATLSDTLLKDAGVDIAKLPSLMDWGCGSGRVGRHFIANLGPGQSYRGFDIDAPAVGWSNARYGNYFAVCDIKPPLPAESACFDLVFAYSVLTHLREDMLMVWLDEMRRVLKPGGLLAFTVLGDIAAISLLPITGNETIKQWRKSGISDTMQNSQLETINVSGDYYKNVWLTREYLSAMLAGFEIITYKPSFHFYQDLVVARWLG